MALSIQEYLARPMPTEKWLVDELVPVGGSLYFYGMPKTGKSLFMLGMAAAISDAYDDFLGFKVHQWGKVLYIQVDMSPTLWHSYVTGAINEGGHPLNQLFIIDRWELPDRSLNFGKQSHVDWLKRQVELVDPILIIFDTFRSMHTVDENDNTLMSNMFEKVLSVTQDRSFVIVHHARKPTMFSNVANDARGATSVAGKVDVIAALGGRSIKKRDLHYDTRSMNTHPDGMELTQNPRSGLFEAKMSPQAIFNQLQSVNPSATVKSLMDDMLERGVSKNTAYRLINGSKSTEGSAE